MSNNNVGKTAGDTSNEHAKGDTEYHGTLGGLAYDVIAAVHSSKLESPIGCVANAAADSCEGLIPG